MITAGGRAALRRAAPVHLNGVWEHWVSHYSNEELQVLADLLGRTVGE